MASNVKDQAQPEAAHEDRIDPGACPSSGPAPAAPGGVGGMKEPAPDRHDPGSGQGMRAGHSGDVRELGEGREGGKGKLGGARGVGPGRRGGRTLPGWEVPERLPPAASTRR
jgi:hypothetical protein